MKIVQIIKPIAIVLAAVGIICAIATPARGGHFHTHKGFTGNYGIDSFKDGFGGITYEYKGLAVTETSDKLIFTVSGATLFVGVWRNGRQHRQAYATRTKLEQHILALQHVRNDLFLNVSRGVIAGADYGRLHLRTERQIDEIIFVLPRRRLIAQRCVRFIFRHVRCSES